VKPAAAAPAPTPKPVPPPPPAPPAVEEPVLEVVEEPVLLEAAEDEPAVDAPGLGKLVKTYKPRKWWLGLLIFGFLFLVNVPCTVAAFWIDDKSKPWIGLTMIPNAAWLIGIIICGGWFLLGVGQRVFLHQRGFKMATPFREAEVRWPDVTAIYLQKTGMFQPTIILLDLEGKPQLDLPHAIKNNEELADRIVAATAPLMKAKINRALDRGDTVSFGTFLSVSPKALIFRPDGEKGETLKLRWKDIESFSMGLYQTNPGAGGLAAAASVQTVLRIIPTDDETPWVCATGNIANFAVLIELVEKRFGVEITR
jgi:hypothetical protein